MKTMDNINFSLLVATFLLTVLLIAIIKNLICFFVLKDKFYFSFMLFLLTFLFIFIDKRFSLFFESDFAASFRCIEVLNITLVSGTTIYFSKYFLNLDIMNRFTKVYFIVELLVAFIALVCFLFTRYISIFYHISYAMVTLYAFYLLFFIIDTYVRNHRKFSVRMKIRYLMFVIMHVSLIYITFSRLIENRVSMSFYFAIFVMIGYLEIDIINRALYTDAYQKSLLYVDKARKNRGYAHKNNERVLTDSLETQIIKLLVEGKIYKEVAFETKIPFNTVKKMISSIYKKNNVKNRNELMKQFYYLQ